MLLLIVISTVVPACSYNSKMLIQDDTSVVEIPVPQAGKSEIEDLPAAENKSNEFEEVKPQDGSSAASLFSASPRRFIDVFYGTVETLDGTVSTSSDSGVVCLFSCISTAHSASRVVHFRPSALYGIRVGTWLENYPYVGFAGDVSYLQANAPGVRIWYVPLSLVMMGRYPFLKTDTAPDGHLQLYGGVMISRVTGDIEVQFSPEMSGRIGGSADGFGTGVLLGIAWRLPPYAVFGEYRLMNASLDFDSESKFFGGSTSASADLKSRQMAFGVSYTF